MATHPADGFAALFGIAVILLIAVYLTWFYSRSKSVLEQWAAANGFVIVHSELRQLLRGPFFWTSSKGQTIYYVRVRDRDGRERSGWVRCGGFWMGLFSDKTEVRWEDE